MTTPALSVSSDSPVNVEADVLVLAVGVTENTPVLLNDAPEFDSLRASLSSLGVSGAKDELTRHAGVGVAAKTIALVGVGSVEPTTSVLRSAAGAATRILSGVDAVALALPIADEEGLHAVLDGAALGAYSYTEMRGKSRESAKLPAETVIVVTDLAHDESVVDRVRTTTEAVNLARDLVNCPPDRLYPETLATAAEEALEGEDVAVTIMREEELAEGGFGGLLGVGGGSARGPRLVKLSYSPEGAKKHLALVGKGITFDTGGLSLKPAASMVGMKYDMAGAASVLATVVAAARLRVPVKITGWLCLAENMPSGESIRPNDVLTVRGGTTIEVLNTDAEGRLVLADGLVAASEENPDAIVDIATLTGAAVVALGNRYTAVMGDDDLVAQVRDAAEVAGELVWPMPLPEELRSTLASDVADIANARIGNSAGGMLLAGVFLKEFIGTSHEGEKTIPWAHLDIAGTANNSSGGYGYVGKGATGVGVRTLLALAESLRVA